MGWVRGRGEHPVTPCCLPVGVFVRLTGGVQPADEVTGEPTRWRLYPDDGAALADLSAAFLAEARGRVWS